MVPYGTNDLGKTIEAYNPELSSVAYYMSALLLEVQLEVPIAVGESYAFGSLELLVDQPDGELKEATIAFLSLRNPLRLLTANMPLKMFFSRYRDVVESFGTLLVEICAGDEGLRKKIEARETDARTLAGAEPMRPFAHTQALLRELAADKEWKLLREQSERHLNDAEEEVVLEARRMMALSLAQSEEDADRRRAVALYCTLSDEGIAEASDIAAQASLLLSLGENDSAKDAVRTGIARFPEAADGYIQIGQAIVEATGDRDFRDELYTSRAGRRTP